MRCRPRKHRHIGDASDVERAARFIMRAEQLPIDVGYERRALSAGRDVCDAEIRDAGDAGTCRDDRRLTDLHGRRYLGRVPHRLSMRADRIQRAHIDAPLAGALQHGRCERLAGRDVEHRQSMRRKIGRRLRVEQAGAEIGAPRNRLEVQERLPEVAGGVTHHLHVGHVDAVDRRARHHAEDAQGPAAWVHVARSTSSTTASCTAARSSKTGTGSRLK